MTIHEQQLRAAIQAGLNVFLDELADEIQADGMPEAAKWLRKKKVPPVKPSSDLNDPYESLPNRARMACAKLGLETKADVATAVQSGILSPSLGNLGNYGRKSHEAVLKWLATSDEISGVGSARTDAAPAK